jgi:hypothetical protein
MESLEPQTHGAAAPADSLDVTTYKRPGAAQAAQSAREPGRIVVTSSSVPMREGAARKRSRAPSFAPRRQRHLKVSPTWQPSAGASLETYHPWENPLYPRIPKAPKLPSEFDGATPTSPSMAPQVFEDGGIDLVHGEPSMWPAVRRVWTWLRGGSR